MCNDLRGKIPVFQVKAEAAAETITHADTSVLKRAVGCLRPHCIFIIASTISLWMQNTLSVAIITSALLAATLFTGQTAKAQATSLGVSPQQLGKTVTSNMTQATPNLEKELVCGTAAVLNGPPGLLVSSVCNYLVGKLNSTSQQQSQPSFTSSPSKGTQPSSTKKSFSTSQPSTTNSLLQQQRQQPSCSDGSQPDANGTCPTPPSNNNQNQEQQQTQECPLGEIIPAENPCPTTNSNPPPSENNPPSGSGSNSNGGGSSSDNVG